MAVSMATCANLGCCDPIILLSYKAWKRYRHARKCVFVANHERPFTDRGRKMLSACVRSWNWCSFAWRSFFFFSGWWQWQGRRDKAWTYVDNMRRCGSCCIVESWLEVQQRGRISDSAPLHKSVQVHCVTEWHRKITKSLNQCLCQYCQ